MINYGIWKRGIAANHHGPSLLNVFAGQNRGYCQRCRQFLTERQEICKERERNDVK